MSKYICKRTYVGQKLEKNILKYNKIMPETCINFSSFCKPLGQLLSISRGVHPSKGNQTSFFMWGGFLAHDRFYP